MNDYTKITLLVKNPVEHMAIKELDARLKPISGSWCIQRAWTTSQPYERMFTIEVDQVHFVQVVNILNEWFVEDLRHEGPMPLNSLLYWRTEPFTSNTSKLLETA
jgi:hypothetical protein